MTPACFSGALPNGSRRYQLRAQYGNNVVDLDDPYRFPPVLSELDLYLLAKAPISGSMTNWARIRWTLDGVHGVAFVVFAPNARRSAWSATSISGMRGGIRCRRRGVGYWSCSSRMRGPATTTSST